MDFIDLARKRYSTRKYKSDKVEDDMVRSILEAGRLSPTARNDQPVRVLVAEPPRLSPRSRRPDTSTRPPSLSSSARTGTGPGRGATTA